MSSSVTRPAVTVINSAVAQTPSYRVWLVASSVSRQLCLYTSSSSLSLSQRQTTSSLPSRPGRHRLSLLAVSFAPRLTLLLPHSHLISCCLHTRFHYWFQSKVARAWYLFCGLHTARVKYSCRLRANTTTAGAFTYILASFFHKLLVWQDVSNDEARVSFLL